VAARRPPAACKPPNAGPAAIEGIGALGRYKELIPRVGALPVRVDSIIRDRTFPIACEKALK
jgi:hypothetical protein